MTHESCAGAGRIAARLAKQVERALAEVDLSLPQYRLLSNLSEGPSQASTLAERLIVSRPSVTALADGLVERGFVTRAAAAGDRRRVIHVLTDLGQKVVTAADEAIDRRMAALAERLSEAESKRAFSGLRSWEKALDAARAEAVSAAEASKRATPAPTGGVNAAPERSGGVNAAPERSGGVNAAPERSGGVNG